MKPAPFAYARAGSLAEVFDLLDAHGSDARILAGGQSLLPTLALRLSSPALLVDIGAIDGLRGISETGDGMRGMVRIGALTRHVEVLESPLVAKRLPLLARALPHVAHAAIRNRGTLGGSLALADPAAELPACMLALDATLVIAHRDGERRVASKDFFRGLYDTALAPGEVLVAAEIPAQPEGARIWFDEFSRRHGDYAIAGLAACSAAPHATPGDPGRGFPDLHLVYFGCGDRPMRAHHTEQAAASGAVTPEALAAALARDLDPPQDLHASPATRLHLAAVLAQRALAAMNDAVNSTNDG